MAKESNYCAKEMSYTKKQNNAKTKQLVVMVLILKLGIYTPGYN